MAGDKPIEQFDWIEYLVFAGCLAISAFTGVYFGFIKKGVSTVSGYLLGNKEMAVFPVSMSLTCSLVSGIALLGIPNETYIYGIHFSGASVGFLLMALVSAYIVIPVFYELQLVSFYEYLEMRFNVYVRKTISFIFTINSLLFTPIVVYAPALALSQVFGLGVHTFTFIVSIVCIFYTSIGGLKAVVWSDTLQGLMMVVAMALVSVVGTLEAGGLSSVLSTAAEGGRLELDMNLDPRVRSSFWAVSLGMAAFFTGSSALNPSSIQRFTALPSLNCAKLSVFYFCLEYFVFLCLELYVGLLAYSKYKGCDLLSSGLIERSDQLVPYYVMDCAYMIPGLPGAFLAGVVSAALSTMSTYFNTLAGTLYYDFIEPLIGRKSERTVNYALRAIVIVTGAACLLMVAVIEKLGAILELVFTLAGMTSGAMIGVLVLGIFAPQANSKGAVVGTLTSFATMAVVFIGSKAAIKSGDIVYKRKPISIDECTFNVTRKDSALVPDEVFGRVFPLFELSPYYYTAFGCLVTVVIGQVVSLLSGSNRNRKLDKKLFSHFVHRFLPRDCITETKQHETNL